MSARRIIHGDALERLRELDTGSAYGMVTDPPSGTGFMGKQWDKNKGGRDAWVAWLGAIFTEARRVLVPGAYVLVWALPRTSHWTALALEAGGFEIRDSLHHVFGSGFPKSLNVGAAVGEAWKGYGTALKPAHEVWWLARAPLGESSIARNVLAHGAGAVNVDGCRVEGAAMLVRPSTPRHDNSVFGGGLGAGIQDEPAGRWPPNFLLSHDCDDACRDGCPVGELDAAGAFFPVFKYAAKPSRAERSAGLEALPLRPSQKLNSGGIEARRQALAEAAMANQQGLRVTKGTTLIRDDGSEALVARFVPSYSANNHPTVKPVELMRWLARLVTPPDGVVLDPFTGSGTTAAACALEGFGFVGIEQDAEYVELARRRVSHFERLAVMPSADVAMRGSQGQRGMFEGLA